MEVDVVCRQHVMAILGLVGHRAAGQGRARIAHRVERRTSP
jgi:hypothetical protein